MRNLKLLSFCVAICVAALSFWGCGDDKPTDGGGGGQTVNRGNYDASRHVGIGVSLTAGFQNNALYEFGQKNSYDYLVAVAAHGAEEAARKFQFPGVRNPGVGSYSLMPPDFTSRAWVSGRVEVNSPGSTQTVINPTTYNSLSGVLLNNALNRPFNNLGISGSLAGFAQNVIGAPSFAPQFFSNNPFYQIVLRDTTYGRNVAEQANRVLAAAGEGQQLVTIWLGPNEILGFASSGGAGSPIFGLDAPTPISPTFSMPPFRQIFDTLLARLQAPNRTIVIFNTPNVATIPFATTVGSVIDTLSAIPTTADIYYQRGAAGGGGIGSARRGTNTIGNRDSLLFLLPASATVPFIGRPSGTPYRNLYNAGVTSGSINPATVSFGQFLAAQGVDTTRPYGLHPDHPFPNAYVLDRAEIVAIQNATTAYNQYFASKAGGNVVVVDIAGLFAQAVTSGITSPDGQNLRPALAATFQGFGLFSLDGVHPNAKGHAIVANEIIKVLNQRFGANIPLIGTRNLSSGIVVQGAEPSGSVGGAFGSFEKALNAYSAQTLMPTIQALGGRY